MKEDQIENLKIHLYSLKSRKIQLELLWKEFSTLFPEISGGIEGAKMFKEVLTVLAESGSIELPSLKGKKWKRHYGVILPEFVLVPIGSKENRVDPKGFPWHEKISWVSDLKVLSPEEFYFLKNVHRGLVHGDFETIVPLKYRSLELCGEEKRLSNLLKGRFFRADRLSLALLGCEEDGLPLAWERISNQSTWLVVENASTFWTFLRVLKSLSNSPYGAIAWGAGRSFSATLIHFKRIEANVTSIEYLGDLDFSGLRIVEEVNERVGKYGLPFIIPAFGLHEAMLYSAKNLGHPNGWPAEDLEIINLDQLERLVEFLPEAIRSKIKTIIIEGNRIPEEVLGPQEIENVLIKS